MMVVDTSALVAVLLREPQAEACRAVLEAEATLLISAGTVAEALIVAGRRGIEPAMSRLIEVLGFQIIPVTADFSVAVAAAYRRWGKGFHPARLNFGDCFAYALARTQDCPLLFVGNDFRQTDIARVLADPAG